MMKLSRFWLYSMTLLIIANIANANVPQLINYQGYVTNAQNQAKVGTTNLSFEIYDAATGGTKTWGPQVFNNVPLVNGYFNVILGTTDQNGTAIREAFNSSASFLQVYDNGEPILPRQQILSTAFALKSQHAITATTAMNSEQALPVGSIVPSMLTESQFNSTYTHAQKWVLANGQSVVGSVYANLTGKSTVPNLQGMFLRGINNNRDDAFADPDDRELGTTQNDMFSAHTHKLFNTQIVRAGTSGGSYVSSFGAYVGNDNYHLSSHTDAPHWGTSSTTGSQETRPKNVGVNYFIRVN